MAISSLLFGVFVWAAVVLVLLVFLYEIYAVLRDTGLLSSRSLQGKS